MNCYALLDDASVDADPAAARSRLYTRHVGTLRCDDIATWPQLLDDLQAALRAGRHAVPLFSYELGARLLDLPAPNLDSGGDPRPLAQVLLFADCRHLTQPEVADWLDGPADGDPADGEAPAAGVAAVTPNVDAAEFARALNRIHDYIEAGDTYQVNYTYRLRFDTFGTPAALYRRLRARQPVPYGALIVLPDGGAVVSLSPELFVRHAGGELLARPMKGTAPAAPADATDAADDDKNRAAALAADPKNRAENLMIVDLLRNDIGRVAMTGSVRVPTLFDVRRYGAVLQMTSSVTARLRPDATLADIFTALYPCGSITGAPKRRTMEIIAELEPAARGIYTGAIGWFEAPRDGALVGDFCLSVPIRTLALQPPPDGQPDGVRRGQLGVGAGIVHDSDAREEYAECLLKARFLTGLGHDFALFETMFATRGDGVRHLERHLARLAASAAYFGFICDVDAIRARLRVHCGQFADAAPRRLRLALDHTGAVTLGDAPLAPLTGPVTLRLADDPVSSSALFARHKTTRRARYDAGWRAAESAGGFDTLFFNERGELAEGGRSSVFVKLAGRWCTPPLSAGVLPGVMRAVLLDDPAWAASERTLGRDDLAAAEEIVVCNALRGVLRARLADDALLT